MEILIVLLFSYLSGSIPFGLLLTKIFDKKDIRKIGSGNIGATNVLRTGNKILAILTLLLDILKGYIPVIISIKYFPELVNLSALIVFLGHIFPIWLKFNGGKGIATYIGFLFGINLFLGFSFIIVWIVIALLTKYSSLSSIFGSLIAPIYFLINYNNYISIFLLYLFVLIFLKHKENIKRLINGTENKIKLSK